MTKVSKADIDHLAKLGNLSLSQEDTTSLQKDISLILDYIDRLSELDTEKVEPTYQVSGLTNVWREDEIEQGVSREELLSLAPTVENNQIKVPKVL